MKNKILSFILSSVIALSLAFSVFGLNLGDYDNDGKVTVKDARATLRCSAKLMSVTDIKNIDIDGNGKISPNDARKILRVAAKLDFFTVYGEFSYSYVPEYSSSAIAVINNNEPYFTESECKVTCGYEYYSPLDNLGRCGYAESCIGKETEPTAERESISSVIPSGWNNNFYSFIPGNSLYNRCHLIGYQLTAENANELNLITGTRYMNTEGMLPYENLTDDYIDRTDNHVLYRVTPIFVGNELVCRGVLMEGYSIEDNGTGVNFCVFCYNVQSGVVIDYSTGKNYTDTSDNQTEQSSFNYILNTSTKKFHLPTCSAVKNISEKNKSTSDKERQELINEGYSPCKICNP